MNDVLHIYLLILFLFLSLLIGFYLSLALISITGGGRVCPTSFRRRVARRWMRVWCNFLASHRGSCKKTKREDMRVRKQRDSTKEKEIEEQGGSQRKGLETLNAEKRKQSRENIPQRMLQTVNG